MDKESFLAELEKLLAFMSSWDREAVIRRYERRISEAEDPEKLLEMLGSATKVAVMLADGYVSSPPPEEAGRPGGAPGASSDGPEQLSLAELLAVDAPETEAAPEPQQRKVRPGGVLLSLLFTLIVGIPVAAALICAGLPFLGAGAGVIGWVIAYVPGALGVFSLFSDVLLVLGAGLALLASGLLLAWLGLWLSITLCRLWIGKAVLPLDGRLCRGKGD